MTSDPRPFWRRGLLKPALALAGLNALLFAVYTAPRLMQAGSLESQRETLRAEVQRERVRLETRRARVDTILGNERDTQRFYKELVKDKDATLLPLLTRLEQVASELGLVVERSSYKAEDVKGAPLNQLTITLPVTGDYRKVVAFLDRLERLPQFLTVDRLAIRGQPDGQGPTSLDLTLSAYFRAEQGRDAL